MKPTHTSVVQDILEYLPLQIALQTSLDLMMTFRLTDGIEYISPSCKVILGYETEELEHAYIEQLFHINDVVKIALSIQNALNKQTPVKIEHRALQRTGNYIWLETYALGKFNENGDVERVILMCRNITQQQSAYLMMNYKDRLFKSAFDNALISMAIVSSSGEFIEVSQSLSQLLGFTEEELLVMTDEDLTHSEDYAEQAKHFNPIVKHVNNYTIEKRYQRKDGEYIWIVMSWSWVEGVDVLAPCYVVQIQDTTYNKQLLAEREQSYQETQRKLAEKEQELTFLKERMTERFSHEFRTPLAIIQSTSELLVNHYERLSPERRDVLWERIKGEIRHFVSMLDDMNLMLREGKLFTGMHTIPNNLSGLISSLVERYKDSIGKQHRFEINIANESLIVNSDLSLIWIAVDHLLTNAIKYTPINTLITVSLYKENGSPVLSITNEGSTVLLEDADRLFDSFYRGHNIEEKRGLGLGLTIVKEIMEAHGGTVEYNSVLNESTTFLLRFPPLAN
jgi:PAS domain S-box-containing protein